MSWVKIDDQMHAHTKVLGCSLAARGLWLTCISWVGDKETDGLLPEPIVRLHGGAGWKKLAAELVEAGLWDREGRDFSFHDYLSYNKSHAQLEAEREVTARRQGDFRQRKRSERMPDNAVSNAVTPPVTDGVTTPVTPPVTTPVSNACSRIPYLEPLPRPTTQLRNVTLGGGGDESPAQRGESASRPTRRDTPPDQPAQRPPTPPGARPRPQAELPTTSAAPQGKPPPRSSRPETRRDREKFIAQTLAQADADPQRRHWRAALADTLSHAAPREPDRYQARILAAWLAGESLPPPPAPEPRALTMRDMEAIYGLSPGEQMPPGPFPSALYAEAERKKAERSAELQGIADRARAADPRPLLTPEANP